MYSTNINDLLVLRESGTRSRGGGELGLTITSAPSCTTLYHDTLWQWKYKQFYNATNTSHENTYFDKGFHNTQESRNVCFSFDNHSQISMTRVTIFIPGFKWHYVCIRKQFGQPRICICQICWMPNFLKSNCKILNHPFPHNMLWHPTSQTLCIL